jgi:hypothetical protein
MKWLLSALTATALFAGIARVSAAEPQLAHMVFFTLADDTGQNREMLVAACRKHLINHDGTVYFSAGALAEDLDREVNDREFDVALHLVFANKQAHDTYQTHERHLKFIEENKHLWSAVRVFDSYLTAPNVDMIPAVARGFAGILRGNVVAAQEGRITVEVSEITNVWRHSKAEDAKALVGKRVVVKARDNEGNIARFLRIAKVGESLKLDVANQDGDTLTLLELTEAQRRRMKE